MENLLEQKIKTNYSNAGNLIEIIRKYDFEEFLNNVFNIVKELITKNETEKLVMLANTVLTKLNAKLNMIESNEDKTVIKYLLGEIFQAYIIQIDQNTQNTFIPNLIAVLKTTSLILNCDYCELDNLLRLNSANKLKHNKNFRNPYYDWLGKNNDFDEFVRVLKDKKIISSIKSFKKLFKKAESEYFIGNPEKVEDLLIIFSILKEKKLIRPRILSGHFTPLLQFGVDNEKKSLFKNAPNKMHELLKRNVVKYNKIRQKHAKWITYSVKQRG